MLRKDISSVGGDDVVDFDGKMNGKNVIMTPESSMMTSDQPGGKTNGGIVPNRKQHKKLVRLLTVAAYVFFVSLGAIVLSLYYVFLWDPQMDKVSRRFTATELSTSSLGLESSTSSSSFGRQRVVQLLDVVSSSSPSSSSSPMTTMAATTTTTTTTTTVELPASSSPDSVLSFRAAAANVTEFHHN